MAALKETTKKILEYLQQNQGEDLTAQDVAEVLDMPKRSVDGSFTSFVKKEMGYREEAEIELADGNHQKVKYLRLTQKGIDFDPDAKE